MILHLLAVHAPLSSHGVDAFMIDFSLFIPKPRNSSYLEWVCAQRRKSLHGSESLALYELLLLVVVVIV